MSGVENFITKSEEKFPGKYDYILTKKTYKNAKTPFKCYCNVHKKEFDIKVSNNHLKSKYGLCPDCKTMAKKDVVKERQQTNGITKFIDTAKDKFDNRFDYEITKKTFKGTKQPCKIYCKIHKIDFEINYAENHINTLCGGCPSCKFIKRELPLVSNIDALEELSIKLKKIKNNEEIKEKHDNDKEIAYTLLFESKGGIECENCESLDENKYCDKCNPVLNRIVREGFAKYCKWPIENKVPGFCGRFLTSDKEACEKHITLFNDSLSLIKKCGKSGCSNVLNIDDKYYCNSCKEKNRTLTTIESLENNTDNMNNLIPETSIKLLENNTDNMNDLIPETSIKSLEKNNMDDMNDLIPETFKQWLAGFFDGDGCISYQCFKHKSTKEGTGFNLYIQFYQTSVEIFEKILRYYPTSNLYEDWRHKDTHKPGFCVKYNGNVCYKIINDLMKYSVLKYKQLALGLEVLSMTKSPIYKNRKKEIYLEMMNLKNKESYKSIEIDPSKITIPYVAGLFDAEGCVILQNNSFTLKLTQDQSPKILKTISEAYSGNVNGKDVCWYSQSKIVPFLLKIEQYLTVKRVQACALLEFLVKPCAPRLDYVAIIYNHKFGLRPDKFFLPISNKNLLRKFENLEKNTFGFVFHEKYHEINDEQSESMKDTLTKLEMDYWKRLKEMYTQKR